MAVKLTGPAVKATFAGCANVMTLVLAVTLKNLITGAAAAKLGPPICVAVMEQSPTEASVTLVPATVQIAPELVVKITGWPEVAVAVRLTGPALSAVSGGCVKVIVCVPCSTLNVLVTGAAAAKVALPACEAVMEQTPAETSVTLAPDTVQIPLELLVKLTASPDVAVAVNPTGPAVKAVSAGCGNVITLVLAVTLNVLVTAAAAAKVASPACEAVIEQPPTETSVTLVPDTVQTAAELLVKLTGSPEVAVAVRLTGPEPSAVSAGCVRLIVCDDCSTLNVTVTGAAAGNVPLPA